MDKYEEALQKARDLYKQIVSGETLGFPEQLKSIFPELAESVDEKIRKWLLEYFHLHKNELRNANDILAWLEKQKEPKLLNNEKYQTVPVEILDRLYAAERELQEIKQKEQKPVKSIFPLGLGQAYFNPKPVVKQKPTGWSEEDEKRVQSILFSIGYCKDEYPNKKDYTKDIDWLKSLRSQPHIFNFYPPSYWKPSEEQMEALGNASTTYELYTPHCEEGYIDTINNLKSLENDLNKL